MSGSSDAQASSELLVASTAPDACAASASAAFPGDQNGKIDICRDASLAPNKTRPKSSSSAKPTMRALEVRYRKIREPASLPLRSGLPVRGRTSACLGLTEQPDGARLLKHEPVTLKRNCSSVSVDVRVRTAMAVSIVEQNITVVQRACKTGNKVAIGARHRARTVARDP